MNKSLFAEYQDRIEIAVEQKKNPKFQASIFSSLSNQDVINHWSELQNKKQRIDSETAYKNYVKELKGFLDNVIEKITSPGVEDVINWLQTVTRKPNEAGLNKLKNFLINHFSEEAISSSCKTILDCKEVLSVDKSLLFSDLIESCKKEIAKKITDVLNKPETIEGEAEEFLSDIAESLEEIQNIDDLQIENIEEFYRDDEKENEIDFYSDLIIQGIDHTSKVTKVYATDEHETLAERVQTRINDIGDFIAELNASEIANATSNDIKLLFEKLKGEIIRNTGSLADSWSDFKTNKWNPLEESYDIVSAFFANVNEPSDNKLKAEMVKWQEPYFNLDAKQVVEKYFSLIANNPLEKIISDKGDKLVKKINDKADEIRKHNVAAADAKEKVYEFFTNALDKYDDDLLPIIESLTGVNSDLEPIAEEIAAQVQILENINEKEYAEKDLFQFLREDFSDFIEVHKALEEKYLQLLTSSGLKPDIDWLNNKMQDNTEEEITVQDLEATNHLKKLLEYNLISIKIEKLI